MVINVLILNIIVFQFALEQKRSDSRLQTLARMALTLLMLCALLSALVRTQEEGSGLEGGWDPFFCSYTSSEGCSEGQGHCVSDSECEAGLVCGINNCKDWIPGAPSNGHCCEKSL